MQVTGDMTHNLKSSLKEIFKGEVSSKMLCVEIGSFEGLGSITINNFLCRHSESILYCIDPFDDEYVKGNEQTSFWNYACKGQKGRFYNNTKLYSKIVPWQGYSDEMIVKLDDNSVDFAYIDGDHTPNQVYKDAINIFPKMKNGSVILFDDYEFTTNGIITADGINKFLLEYSGNYELLLKNWQLAIRVKTK
jgi:hypothetical protein